MSFPAILEKSISQVPKRKILITESLTIADPWSTCKTGFLYTFLCYKEEYYYNKESSDRLNWISLCTCYNCKYSPLPVVYLHEYLSNIESDIYMLFFPPISFFIFDHFTCYIQQSKTITLLICSVLFSYLVHFTIFFLCCTYAEVKG